jgi:N utilization substance protein A
VNYDILEAIGQITKDKNLEPEYVIETLEAGLISAAKKKFGAENIVAKFDRKTGQISMHMVKKVVKQVAEPALEISLAEAKEINSKAKAGEELHIPLHFEDFGRNAIATAKQVLIQKIREAERDRIFEEYQSKVGELTTGAIQQVDRGNVIINLGRTEGIMPPKEQIPKERYRQGERIRIYILDVQKSAKSPQIVLSRAHSGFLQRLFELEVPEIFEKIIEIKAVAREAGERSKIAVHSIDERIDPVGACVGIRGTRVQGIVRELSNERIDVIQWSPEVETLVARALAPAKIIKIDQDKEEKIMTVVVEDQGLSVAIGKNGQNARLTSKLTGWKITVMSQSELVAKKAEAKEKESQIRELKGVGEKLADNLIAQGFGSVEALAEATPGDLTEIEGIGEKKAAKLIQTAREYLEEKKATQADEETSGEGESEAERVETEESREKPMNNPGNS